MMSCPCQGLHGYNAEPNHPRLMLLFSQFAGLGFKIRGRDHKHLCGREGKQHDAEKVYTEMNLVEHILSETAKTSATYQPLKSMQPRDGRQRKGQHTDIVILIGENPTCSQSLAQGKL